MGTPAKALSYRAICQTREVSKLEVSFAEGFFLQPLLVSRGQEIAAKHKKAMILGKILLI